MDNRTKRQIVEVLSAMLKDKNYPRGGICSYLNDKLELPYATLQPYSRSWDQYSGNPSYPVPSFNKKYNEEDVYWHLKNIWAGKYGAARKSLVKHIIKRLKEELANV